MYLLRGRRVNLSSGGEEEIGYSARFLTDNDMTKLTTKSLTESIMTTLGGTSQGGKYAMVLSFDEESGQINISQLDSTTVSVSGTGTLYSKDQTTAERYNNARHRRSEEHTSGLQSLMRISYAVFGLTKKKRTNNT